jgi:hypothetical protein
MTYETIDLSVGDGVARIELNRPQAANSMNVELARELMDATLACDENPAAMTRGKASPPSSESGRRASRGNDVNQPPRGRLSASKSIPRRGLDIE